MTNLDLKLIKRVMCRKKVQPGHFFEWFEFFFVEEMKLGDKVVEVLVAGVDMGFRSNGHHLKKSKALLKTRQS
jgi:hypothetical protein